MRFAEAMALAADPRQSLPMQPYGITQMQRLPQAEVFSDRVSTTPNVDKTLPLPEPGYRAQDLLAGHLRPATHNVMGSPQLNAALQELSGIVQGRDIGTGFDADAGPMDPDFLQRLFRRRR